MKVEEKELSPTKALIQFFNTEGYEPLKAAELVAFKKADPEGFKELGKLAQKALG